MALSKEARRKYQRDYYRKRRELLITLLGGKCVWCGSRDHLELDHIDGSTKKFKLSKTHSVEKTLKELRKCQLLCRCCHRRKTAGERAGFTHGTVYAWMKKKCLCITCAKAKREWYNARNTARRKKAA
jgi:hypothetical protein